MEIFDNVFRNFMYFFLNPVIIIKFPKHLFYNSMKTEFKENNSMKTLYKIWYNLYH